MATINPGAFGTGPFEHGSLGSAHAGRREIAGTGRRSAYAVGALLLLIAAPAGGAVALLSLTFADTTRERANAGLLLFVTFSAMTWATLLVSSAMTGRPLRARVRLAGRGIWVAHAMFALLGAAFAVGLTLMSAGEGALATIL